ncbi:hypothetical protein [Silvibacterium acidisoli]|uniref:hypothetical protein n=1 Tax=Acidobacteriaceae bacterium ZG23-2 TaxID=2883246 RepID=UPI00406D2A8E
MNRTTAALTCLPVLALAIGCRHQESPAHAASFEDLATAAINRYYQTEPSCLWFEPVALLKADKPDPETLPGLEALAAQGLVSRAQGSGGPYYKLAVPGRPYFRPDPDRPGYGNLCYGKPHVHDLGKIEKRHDQTFGDVTDVEYNAALSNAPAWTAAPAIRQAFPKMALELSQPLPEIATLKDTGHGWDVAVGPANALPSGPAPK